MGVDVTGALQRTIREAAAEEYHRLLYVALTRASDRLVVCGWQQKRTVAEDCCTACAGRGSSRRGRRNGRSIWAGRTRLVLEAPAAVPSTETRAARAEAVPAALLPDWMGSAPGWKATPPPVEAALMRPLAPSRPDDAPLGPQPAVRSPLAIAQARRPAAREQALRRGEIVHALLQYLPDHPPARRREVALAWLARPGNGLDLAEQARIAGQVLAVMDEPALAPCSAPAAGRSSRWPVWPGAGDRGAGGPDGRLPGRGAAVRLQDQPAAAGGRGIDIGAVSAPDGVMPGADGCPHPDRPVRCTLVWTEEVRIMPLPDRCCCGMRPARCRTDRNLRSRWSGAMCRQRAANEASVMSENAVAVSDATFEMS
jgi:ATP-dependent helicase/nuclease subunit A